ncbi:hypothetical protein LRAMOSA03813 [Lichtheimia ramosa]|uniref:Uncharacterized protein n=1 Tax=Lichtheimia ramosa TaxID=688394 RepID=A0A077WW85_9FUNG|nr:hypothetical protein LRAMOSA03813 [Lichtheimia ramosa]
MIGSWLALLTIVGLWQVVVCEFSPSVPEPGTVWQAGKEYDIIWGEEIIQAPQDRIIIIV